VEYRVKNNRKIKFIWILNLNQKNKNSCIQLVETTQRFFFLLTIFSYIHYLSLAKTKRLASRKQKSNGGKQENMTSSTEPAKRPKVNIRLLSYCGMFVCKLFLN